MSSTTSTRSTASIAKSRSFGTRASGGNNVYTLQSPLIKTEKRALKVAEAILANLNRYRGLLNSDDIPRTTEIILSFDDEFDEFSRKLQQLSKEWEASGLREGQR